MNVGPSPARARSTAARAADQHAMGSKPSTRTDGIAYAAERSAIVAVAICLWIGVEIAHWLLTQKKTVATLNTEPKFIASWKSPSDVAPSPNHTNEAVRSPF